MTTDLPPFTATYPDVELTNGRPLMPEWFHAYMVQRRRALQTEMHEIDKMLKAFDNLDSYRIGTK
jgi:hypothetical protein